MKLINSGHLKTANTLILFEHIQNVVQNLPKYLCQDISFSTYLKNNNSDCFIVKNQECWIHIWKWCFLFNLKSEMIFQTLISNVLYFKYFIWIYKCISHKQVKFILVNKKNQTLNIVVFFFSHIYCKFRSVLKDFTVQWILLFFSRNYSAKEKLSLSHTHKRVIFIIQW